jgi:hypothetical protein
VRLEDFAEALGWQLRGCGASFDPAEVQEFAADIWPLPNNRPDPARWAGMFLVLRWLGREQAWTQEETTSASEGPRE